DSAAANAAHERAVGASVGQVVVAVIRSRAAQGSERRQAGWAGRHVAEALHAQVGRASDDRRHGIADDNDLHAAGRIVAVVGHAMGASDGAATGAADKWVVFANVSQVGVAIVTGCAAQGQEGRQTGGARRDITEALYAQV